MHAVGGGVGWVVGLCLTAFIVTEGTGVNTQDKGRMEKMAYGKVSDQKGSSKDDTGDRTGMGELSKARIGFANHKEGGVEERRVKVGVLDVTIKCQ